MEKKILVTGGAGFIAGHVIEVLQAKGYKVITTIRNQVPDLDYLKKSEISTADNRDASAIRMLVEKVDGVINLAGILGTTIKSLTDMDVFYDNNVTGSHNVMKACHTLQIPLIQIAVGNHFENNWYSNTKTAIEKDVLAASKYLGLKANLVRGLNVFGERQKVHGTGKIIPTFITKALKNEPLQVYGGIDKCSVMDMIYVQDIAKILVDTLEFTIDNSVSVDTYYYGHVFEAGTGIGYSVYEIAERIIKLANSKSIIDQVPMRLGESENSKVVASNPYEFDYTDLDQALIKTINYYKNI